MQNALATALLVASTIPSLAAAQQTHLHASRDSTGLNLEFIELDGGALVAAESENLDIFVGGPLVPQDVEWIGQEAWIATGNGIHRFSAPPISYLGQILAADRVAAILETPNGALAFTSVGTTGEVVELDASGVEIGRSPFPRVWDVAAFQGGYAVVKLEASSSDALEFYDSQFGLVGQIGAELTGLGTTIQIGVIPRTVTALSSGGLAVGASVSVGIVDPAGAGRAVYNPGLFELGCIELPTGELFVPAGLESSILDPITGASVRAETGLEFAGSSVFSNGSRDLGAAPAIDRTCVSSANSTGQAGRLMVLGMESVAAQTLNLGALGIPAAETGVFAWGAQPTLTPFGDGTLCISAAGAAVRSRVVSASADGTAELALDLATPGLGSAITAGSSWTFQYLFRDAAGASGFNSTDAVRVTFAN